MKRININPAIEYVVSITDSGTAAPIVPAPQAKEHRGGAGNQAPRTPCGSSEPTPQDNKTPDWSGFHFGSSQDLNLCQVPAARNLKFFRDSQACPDSTAGMPAPKDLAPKPELGLPHQWRASHAGANVQRGQVSTIGIHEEQVTTSLNVVGK